MKIKTLGILVIGMLISVPVFGKDLSFLLRQRERSQKGHTTLEQAFYRQNRLKYYREQEDLARQHLWQLRQLRCVFGEQGEEETFNEFAVRSGKGPEHERLNILLKEIAKEQSLLLTLIRERLAEEK